MELFLNFVWLLLFVPACWVWRRQHRNICSSRCFLSLACALVILFPVISATDDLHAAPQAMEESSATKRALKQASIGKAECHPCTPPSHVLTCKAVAEMESASGDVLSLSYFLPQIHDASTIGERAPPRIF